MRLIDADNPKLRAALYTYTRFSGIYEAPDEHADQELDLAPTVEERRKGKWIGKPIAGYSTVRCSCCEEVFLENEGKWNYCPNCGADMRGERDEI